MEKGEKRRQIIKDYLVLLKYYPIIEAQWIPANNFVKPSELQKYSEEDDPQEQII